MMYRNLNVFDFVPDFKEPESAQADDFTLDSGGVGLATPHKATGVLRRTVSLPVVLRGREQISAARQFIGLHRARQRPFWIPTWFNDLQLVADAAAGDDEIVVAGRGFSERFAGGKPHQFICLLTRAGKFEMYGVTELDDDAGNDVLKLSRVLDTDLVAGDTLCCPLLLARFVSDDQLLEYVTDELASWDVAVIETPVEYPSPEESSNGENSAHFGTRPVFLFRITDGITTLQLADYGVDVEAADETWSAADISAGDVASTLDMLGDTLDIALRTDDPTHPLLQYLDRLNARNFSVEVWYANLDNLSALNLAAPDHSGRIESVSLSPERRLTITVSSLFRTGEQRIPKFQMQRFANHSVFEGENPTSVEAFTTTGTITAVSSDPAYIEATEFGDAATAESDPDWFALGKVTCNGEVRLCTGQDGNRLYLNFPFATAAVDDEASAVAGDDGRIQTWALKYDKLEEFPGFPLIPARNPHFKALSTPKPDGGKK
ncbi:MAG TPA: hypothetical protein PKA41_10200 [Verrucomicrobiota bacterium]|nr:hypothetical protein [Verrucomicrobiota bacterium]